jgi:hypothetical protein
MATHGLPGLQLAVIPGGRTIAIWEHQKGPLVVGGSMEVATSADGLHFGPARVIAKTGALIHDCSSPKLLLERTSNVIAEWTCSIECDDAGRTKPVVEFARYRP